MPPSSPPVLLDGNVLVALAYSPHVQHPAARRWFLEHTGPLATCPITQGTLVRMLLNFGAVSRIEDALAVLRGFVEHPRHCFWQDSLDCLRVDMKGVIDHKQSPTPIWPRWRAATAAGSPPSTRAWRRCTQRRSTW